MAVFDKHTKVGGHESEGSCALRTSAKAELRSFSTRSATICFLAASLDDCERPGDRGRSLGKGPHRPAGARGLRRSGVASDRHVLSSRVQ
jgi:hypothetical protein